MTPQRWDNLMAEFDLPPNHEMYDKLVAAYGETHRAYHTGAHIEACLRHLDSVKDDVPLAHEVEFALWFHDAVYQPFSGTNEEDSADWAETFLLSQSVNAKIVPRVKRLILITKHHAETTGPDEAYMIDIDLSILGAPVHVYDEFEQNIRREYKKVPRFIFRKKRKAILTEFLERERLYQTDHFHGLLETRAKQNLERAIAAL